MRLARGESVAAALACALALSSCSPGTGSSQGATAETPDASVPATPPSRSQGAEPRITLEPSPDPGPAEQRRLDRRLVDASWANDLPRARRLIQQGADVNWRDETRQSAFLIATSEGYLDLLELTLAHGADVGLHDRFDGTGLIRAAERGHWRVVERLLRTPMEVDHVNNLGWTALLEAVILGDGSPKYQRTVARLLDGGADPGIADAQGVTPLQHARSRGQDEVAHLLAAANRAG